MKLLVATDGSKFANKTFEAIRGFATDNDKLVVKIISVVERFTPMTPDAFGVAIDYYREAEKIAGENAEEVLEKAISAIKQEFAPNEVEVIGEVIRGKQPKHAIVDEAKEWGADLIVVGSHGYGFWDRMLLGSVSSAVVHHAPCSVLVVR